jgi:hypothetical protein
MVERDGSQLVPEGAKAVDIDIPRRAQSLNWMPSLKVPWVCRMNSASSISRDLLK